MIRVIQFAPLNWEEVSKNGFRKTSGAMFRELQRHSWCMSFYSRKKILGFSLRFRAR